MSRGQTLKVDKALKKAFGQVRFDEIVGVNIPKGEPLLIRDRTQKSHSKWKIQIEKVAWTETLFVTLTQLVGQKRSGVRL